MPYSFPDSPDSDAPSLVPVISVDFTDEKETLLWINETHSCLADLYQESHETAKLNICRYLGFYYGQKKEPTVGGAARTPQRGSPRWPRVGINHAFDLVEQKVNLLTKTKPTTEVIPYSDEERDKADAIFSTRHLVSVKDRLNIEDILTRMTRSAIVGGTGIVEPYWNPYIGPLHPDYKRKKDLGERIEKIGDDGKPEKDLLGRKIYIDLPVTIGDIDIRLWRLWDVFPLPAYSLAESPGVFTQEFIHVDQLKEDYPEFADEIKEGSDLEIFDGNLLDIRRLQKYARVVTVKLRSSKYFPDGLLIKATETKVLEIGDNPLPPLYEDFSYGNVNFRFLTDIDVEGELLGRPSANQLNIPQAIHDRMTSLFHKNVFTFCNPKIAIYEGSCDPASFGDDGLYVWWSGPQPPRELVFNAITQDMFAFYASVLEQAEKAFGVFSVSRGAPPPGTRTAASLYFYEEQETQRASSVRRKIDKLITSMDRLIVHICANYYLPADKRVIEIMGRDKTWAVETVDLEALKKPKSIRVVASSALPDSKFARIDTLVRIMHEVPGTFTKEQFLNALDFGQHEALISYGQIAVRVAQQENEDFQRARDVLPAERHEEHLAHWQEHVKLIQLPAYKKLPPKRKEEVEAHIGGHEAFMVELAMDNPAFKQILTQIPNFPVFIILPRTSLLPEEQQQMQGESQKLMGQEIPEPPPPAFGPAPPVNGGQPAPAAPEGAF